MEYRLEFLLCFGAVVVQHMSAATAGRNEEAPFNEYQGMLVSIRDPPLTGFSWSAWRSPNGQRKGA